LFVGERKRPRTENSPNASENRCAETLQVFSRQP